MRISLTFLVLAACLALCAYADQSPCHMMITTKARADSSWCAGGIHYQIYDITITNQGTCPLTRIAGFFKAYETGGFISEAWNYDVSSGLFSSYGDALGAGHAFSGAGFVLANASMPVLGLTYAGCPDSCYNSTAAPNASAPTTSPPVCNPPPVTPITTSNPATVTPITTSNPSTTTPITTSNPSTVTPTTISNPSTVTPTTISNPSTATPTTISNPSTATPTTTHSPSTVTPTTISNPSTVTPTITSHPSTVTPITTSNPSTATPTTATPSSCPITYTLIRDSYWFMDQGRNTSVYRLIIVNNGPCALKSFIFTSDSFVQGTVITYANIKPATGGYLVTGYGSTLESGTAYSAWMMLAGAPNNIAITPHTTCAC